MFWIVARFYVRIPRTLLYLVPYLFAAVAPHILELLLIRLLGSLGVCSLVLIILFALMLAEFTPRGLLGVLSAAPPHLATPLTLMSPARPVVVLLLKVLFSALLTNFLIVFYSEASVLELGDALLHLVSLHLKLLRLLDSAFQVLFCLIEVCCEARDLRLLLIRFLLHLSGEDLFVHEKFLSALTHLL